MHVLISKMSYSRLAVSVLGAPPVDVAEGLALAEAVVRIAVGGGGRERHEGVVAAVIVRRGPAGNDEQGGGRGDDGELHDCVCGFVEVVEVRLVTGKSKASRFYTADTLANVVLIF